MSLLTAEPLETELPPSSVRLSDLPSGQLAAIIAVSEPGELGERLMELGMTVGTTVEVVRRGLFGDPLQLRLRGFMLSVRNRQAQAIQVRPLG